jgi:threonine efflux protein
VTGYELTLLWIAWLIAGGSPGPATLSIAGTSMNEGRRTGLMFSCGILAGSAFWGVAAALGMSALMLANAWVFSVLRYAGAAYLLFLAYKSIRSATTPDRALIQKGHRGTAAQVFAKGALIHITNPKAILSWGAIYAITVSNDAGPREVFWMFGFLYSASIIVFIGYAFLFSTPGVVRVYQSLRRWFEMTFALLFGAAGLKILTVQIE